MRDNNAATLKVYCILKCRRQKSLSSHDSLKESALCAGSHSKRLAFCASSEGDWLRSEHDVSIIHNILPQPGKDAGASVSYHYFPSSRLPAAALRAHPLSWSLHLLR